MGKNDKWDHNYEPDESKVSWSLFRKMMRETNEATGEMAAENEKRSEEAFNKSWYGKRWRRFERRMNRTKKGRKQFAILYVSLVLGGLVALFGLRLFLPEIGDWMIPMAYQLSDAQKAEGYDRTCTGGYKSCTLDNVAFRTLTSAEFDVETECQINDGWCLYAIPLDTECTEIVIKGNMTETEGFLAPSIEDFEKSYKPSGAQFIEPGQRITIGIEPKSAKSQYLSVNEAFCYGAG
jgi:hypothetical protein